MNVFWVDLMFVVYVWFCGWPIVVVFRFDFDLVDLVFCCLVCLLVILVGGFFVLILFVYLD